MRWRRRRTKPSVQIYDAAPYETQVIEVNFDTVEAERQLQHANQQLELTRYYPRVITKKWVMTVKLRFRKNS